jgi:hypothetical protein
VIYVISDGNRHLKVGRATTVAKRLQDLQTGDADMHRLVGAVRLRSRVDEVLAERDFHRAFTNYRAKGGGTEWYHDHKAIRCWLRALALGNRSVGLED